MDVQSKIDLIRSEPLEEIITEERLKALLETNSKPRHYIGLEISGMPHVGHILVAGKKINDLDKAGVKTQVLLADWHTMANNKLGGDWERIIKVAAFYRKLFGIVCPNTRVVLGSDLYKENQDYWKTVVQMARKTTLARATRTLVIQGRSEKETLYVSQYIYPMMQAADIHALDVQIPHAGMDQRRIHVLAIELFKELKLGEIVPIHHHLVPSLTEPPKVSENAEKEEIVAAMKMSKSKPGSAIPILATKGEVAGIMKSAWCPEGVVESNPVLELCRYVIFANSGSMKIERSAKFGGDVTFASYKELEDAFAAKKLHPLDLKKSAGDAISEILHPISSAFSQKEKEEIQELINKQL